LTVFGELLAQEDEALRGSMKSHREGGLPSIDVPALLGKFLALMVQISGGRQGARDWHAGRLLHHLAGARAARVAALITLEIDPHHADIAAGIRRRRRF